MIRTKILLLIMNDEIILRALYSQTYYTNIINITLKYNDENYTDCKIQDKN